jgi:hypothetical protein
VPFARPRCPRVLLTSIRVLTSPRQTHSRKFLRPLPMIEAGLARCSRNHNWDGVFPSHLHLEDLARPITDLDLGETGLRLP